MWKQNEADHNFDILTDSGFKSYINILMSLNVDQDINIYLYKITLDHYKTKG
jgi:hypothetical protein